MLSLLEKCRKRRSEKLVPDNFYHLQIWTWIFSIENRILGKKWWLITCPKQNSSLGCRYKQYIDIFNLHLYKYKQYTILYKYKQYTILCKYKQYNTLYSINSTPIYLTYIWISINGTLYCISIYSTLYCISINSTFNLHLLLSWTLQTL